jgi:hypothetical protein
MKYDIDLERTISRRLVKCRSVAATIPGTPAILSKKRIRYDLILALVRSLPTPTYIKPRAIIEKIAGLSKFLDSHFFIGWDCNMLVARRKVKDASSQLDHSPRHPIRKGCPVVMQHLKNSDALI